MAIDTITLKNDVVKLIDQTKLPLKKEYIYCKDVPTLIKAIKRLSVRGAPALGVAAAFGIVLGSKKFKGNDRAKFDRYIERISEQIAISRPTAVNLFYALERIGDLIESNPNCSVVKMKQMIRREALAIFNEDKDICRKMGKNGVSLIKKNATVMTICNAGALATSDFGTALGVFYQAKKSGKKFKVVACETRPLLQGARLTTWELMHEKIDTTLICDNMAATLMKQGKIDAIFTGADRIAANGDTANKIGTYNLAVLAKYHKIPFYIVAPSTTFDLKIALGKQIPIEQRDADEVKKIGISRIAPSQVKVYNPAFDVTDARLITGIVTEVGVITPPYKINIKKKIKNS